MCEFCDKHGRGNRWYLSPENFSDAMLEDPRRAKTLEAVAGWGIDYYIDFTSRATQLVGWPVIGRAVKALVNRMAPDEHGGQVVSLEDSLQLLEYARDFVLLPCACRRLLGHRNELVCLDFGPIKDLQGSAMPEGPMEEITLEEAKEVVRQADARGNFHQVLYAKMPFPICICNCDSRYCTSLKQRFANQLEIALLKGHEVCRKGMPPTRATASCPVLPTSATDAENAFPPARRSASGFSDARPGWGCVSPSGSASPHAHAKGSAKP